MLTQPNRSRLALCLVSFLSVSLLTGCAGLGKNGSVENQLPGREFLSDRNGPSVEMGAGTSLTRALAKGRSFEKTGQWDKAREVYEPLLTQHADRYEPFHRLGVVADRQRRHREAQTLFVRALQINSRDAQIHNDLGYCFFLQGQLPKAESSLVKATRLDPLKSRYWNNLGMVYGHQGRLDEALDVFRQAGSEADAQFNLAFVLASQDEAEAATICFEWALAADPTHEKARKALKSFQQFEKSPERFNGAGEMMATDGYYVPFVEGGESGGAVQQASHVESTATPSDGVPPATCPQPRDAARFTRALHDQARALRTNPSETR
jgi:Flp pilus assembly protein TadD